MAASARTDRQLMRQRGAGSRSSNNVDFGINFGSHGSRDERQLMRTRGAGNRKIDKVNFNFAFSMPDQSRRANSKTPQSNRTSTRRASRTPVEKYQEPQSGGKTQHDSASESRLPSAERTLSQTSKTPTDLSERSHKRRKLGSDYTESTFRPSSQQRKSSGPVFTIAEELQPLPSANSNQERAAEQAAESPVFIPADIDKENQDIGTNSSELKTTAEDKPKETSAPRRITRSPLIASHIPSEPDVATEYDNQPAQLSLENNEGFHDSPSNTDMLLVLQTQNRSIEGTTSQRPAKKRRKRKSVVLGRKKRRSSGETSLVLNTVEVAPQETGAVSNPTDPVEATTELEEYADDRNEAEQTSAEPVTTAWKSKVAKRRIERRKRRSRLSMSATPEAQQVDDQEADETYIDEQHSPEPITPAPKRKAVPKRKRRSTDELEKPKHYRSKNTFPIQVHRMTNIESLPIILEESNEINANNESANETGAAMETYKDRSAPNAVDVLAQICRETLESTIEQLNNKSKPGASKAEVNRKRIALETFGQELDQRLFDMSEAVENRLTLEARLRKSRREKAELQARWIEVRRQRDILALRADDIRRQNWENEEIGKLRWEVSEVAQRTELAMKREQPAESLEFMLEDVGGLVGRSSSGRGLLDTVKAFNERLELLANNLEQR